MVDRVICLAVCLGLGFDICQASVGDIVIDKGEPKVWTTNAYPEMRTVLRKVGAGLCRTRRNCRTPEPRATRFRGGRAAAFQLAFDDACTSQLEHAIPLLEKYRIPGTFYICPDNKMFRDHEDEWTAVVRRGFVRLGNHTWDHAGRSNLVELVSSLDRCNAVIRRVDPAASAPHLISFAVPGCKTWPLAKPYIEEAKRTCGLVERPGYYGPSARFMQKPEDALAVIEDARTRRGLGHLDFHGVGGNWHKVSPEYLEAVLKRLDALRDEMWLTTDAERQTYEALRDSAEIRVVGREKGRMEIEYRSPLDPACYDLPLTLEIPVPDGWTCVKVRPVGAEPVRTDVREGFVRIETRPGTVIVERL